MNRILSVIIVLTLCLVQPRMGVSEELSAPPTGMFALYGQNRTQGIPNYITEDFILLSYSMLIDKTITQLEETTLMPGFHRLVQGLISQSRTALDKIKDKDNKKAAIHKANLDYFSVLSALLSGKENAPDAVDKEAVAAELQQILQAKGIALSGLMHQKIDYTQFQVRGKYTQTKELTQYFRAMRYAGTVLFPVLESQATGISDDDADLMTQQVMAMNRLIQTDEVLLGEYQQLSDQLSWIFGPPDDLTLADYDKISNSDAEMATSKRRHALLEYARKNGAQPAIIGSIVDANLLKEEKKTAVDVLTGFRFMPQRFTPDSAAFQELVYDRVQTFKGSGTPFSTALIQGKRVKGYPLGLELMAALGSKEAGDRLKKSGDQNYDGYSKAYERALGQLAKPAGLASEHLEFMSYWLTRGALLQSKVDDSRRLNTALALWTRYRHASLLYTKQSYTVSGKGFSMAPPRQGAWLEPIPEFYLLLGHKVRAFTAHVFPKNTPEIKEQAAALTAFADILDTCSDIAWREIKTNVCTPDDSDFLNKLDERLLKLTGEDDQPVVVDVHSEPTSGLVLEEGLGYPAIVTRDIKGATVPARGGLFNYYEFKHPMDDRLTNEKWGVMLKDKTAMQALKRSPGTTKQ